MSPPSPAPQSDLPAPLAAFLAAAALSPTALDPEPDLVPPPAVAAALAALGAPDRGRATAEPVSAAVGRVLFAVCRARRARRVVELGTGLGAAALWMGAALNNTGGQLLTLERDSARAAEARRHIKAAGLDGRVTVWLGDAARFLARPARPAKGKAAAGAMAGPWDLVFLDEAPLEREAHFLDLLPRLPPGALIISHGGRRHPADLARFNARLRAHPDVVATLTLSVGDGLDMAVVKG